MEMKTVVTYSVRIKEFFFTIASFFTSFFFLFFPLDFSSSKKGLEFFGRALRAGESLLSLQLAPSSSTLPPQRYINPVLADLNDFECALCFKLIFQPITTTCGHTYCRSCLDRSLDHANYCPMCKGDLSRHLAERREALDEFVSETIKRLFPEVSKNYIYIQTWWVMTNKNKEA